MYKREAEALVRKYATWYPCVGINGPRQSGKSTLAQTVFPQHAYVSFENPHVRQRAQSDWLSFLDLYRDGAIFDEIQHVPELLSYLQEMVDTDQRTGRFILTSSQNFLFSSAISQSLAGRIGLVTLLPLSYHERTPELSLNDAIITGGFPRLHVQGINPYNFYTDYLTTYIERDIRNIKNIGKLSQFQNFIRLCAGRIGQVINHTSLAQDAGISSVTAQAWLTILQASYIIFLVSPYHTNMNKRLIKAPKLYFYDTGLAATLLEIETSARLAIDKARGHLVENFVVLELLKARANQGKSQKIYFWRDYKGHEVDVIVEWGGVLKAIEIKSTSTFSNEFIKPITDFCAFAPLGSQPYIIYTGATNDTVQGVKIIPFSDAHLLANGE